VNYPFNYWMTRINTYIT